MPIADSLPSFLGLIFIFLVSGAFSGVMAGLLGVGGGLIMVPVLFHTLNGLGYESSSIHTAIATSLAVIILTSIRSTLAHNKKGTVDSNILRHWLGWLFLGGLLGSFAGGALSGSFLTGVFGSLAIILSGAFLKPERKNQPIRESLPSGLWRAGIGSGIGGLSALMGIGGGSFGVPLMHLCGIPIHRAVGTSAAFGAIIAFPGMIGYVFAGWEQAGRAPWSLGYVNVPGWLMMAAGAVIMAPFGVELAHRTKAEILRRVFGVALALNGAHMLYKALT